MPSMSSITNFPPMKMATPALVSNISKQNGIQKVAPNGILNNTGSQIGVQVRRKKRSAQFKNYRSQIGQQFGRKKRSAQFNNFGSQIQNSFAESGRKIVKENKSVVLNNFYILKSTLR